MDLSLALLDANERERYEDLAVFPEDIDVPLATVAKVWQAKAGLDAFESEELCQPAGSEKKMLDVAATRMNAKGTKRALGVDHWIHDVSWREALEMLVSRPTVNIEGLVGGYTGPGGKTILPHRAVAKLDLRLVPDMTAHEALAAPKAHLQKHGFGDIEVNMTGGYGPTSTRRIRRWCEPTWRYTGGQASIRSSCLGLRAPGRDISSRAIRSGCLPAISVWVTAAARTRRTSTT
jgi:hypothetical protein